MWQIFHVFLSLLCFLAKYLRNLSPNYKIVPRSVNYHFTRQCNYKCGFCFHTAKTSFKLPLGEAKHGLELLKTAGLEKINFAGGEPFLISRGEYLGELVEFCKKDLRVSSVSIVSNGSRITEKWFKKYGNYVDILAISCDSFNEETNIKIGRHERGKHHVQKLMEIREWCRKYDVLFKLNTVVNSFNYDEDMNEKIKLLDPVRWKVFQCLLLEGENVGEDSLRNAEPFWIDQETFQSFLDRHNSVDVMVPEDNTTMKDSYLILDEYMRFLDCSSGKKVPSKSLLDVGVDNALSKSGFDDEMFLKRGGKYKWSKGDTSLDW